MADGISKKEAADLKETVKMFEEITQSQPEDWQSLEILKEAYDRLGRAKDAIRTSRRLAEACVPARKFGRAIAECEGILKVHPEDYWAKEALREIREKLAAGIYVEGPEEKPLRVPDNSPSPTEDIARRLYEETVMSAEVIADPRGLRRFCWMTVKALNWNLPVRGYLLERWLRRYREGVFTLNREFIWMVEYDVSAEIRIFALDMLLTLPPMGRPLCETLPLEPREPGETDDQVHGRRYRAKYTSTLGPKGAARARDFAEFAGEYRQALELIREHDWLKDVESRAEK